MIRSDSIKNRMISIIVGIVLTFVLLLIFLNSIFLKPYYTYIKEQALTNSFTTISRLDFDSANIQTQLESLEERKNIQILIIDNNFQVFFCSNEINDSLFFPIDDSGSTDSGEQWFFRDWLIPDSNSADSVEIFTSKPTLGRRYNEALAAEYLSLYAKATMDFYGTNLPFYIIINTPIAAIDDGVRAANNFTLMVGAAILTLGCIASALLSQRFTSPIVQMSKAAKKMARLDFSERVECTSDDELGQLGESINYLSSELETKISELKDANKQLKLDIEQKDKTDKMRRELISNISHDLKTPLSIILGYCEGLQANINSDEDREFYCSVIEGEALRMSSIASRLLDLAELESCNRLDTQIFDLAQLCSERVQKLGYLAGERSIKTDFESCGDCIVNADRERIEEVINNILSNAIHHTPDGGNIKVSVNSDGDRVSCRVFNSGSHIPEESLDRIWDSFYKVDKARTRSYGGSGLGLKIVSTILDMHGAEFGATNLKDGVAFFFIMKKADGSDPAADPDNFEN